jgi:membrane protein implicated in regulation of membrane protease activity
MRLLLVLAAIAAVLTKLGPGLVTLAVAAALTVLAVTAADRLDWPTLVFMFAVAAAIAALGVYLGHRGVRSLRRSTVPPPPPNNLGD